MTPEQFRALKVGDRVRRKSDKPDDTRVFIMEVVKEPVIRYSSLHVEFKVVEHIEGMGQRDMPAVGSPWGTNEKYAHFYTLVWSRSEVEEIARALTEPSVHIAGLSPETVDWDAHKAFTRDM